MDLSLSLKKVLKNNDVQDVESLFALTEDQLRSLKGVGDKTLEEINSLKAKSGGDDEDYPLPDIDDEPETVEAKDGSVVNKATGEVVKEAPKKKAAPKEPEAEPTQESKTELATPPKNESSGVQAGFEKKMEVETQNIADSMIDLENETIPILDEIKRHTMIARKAMDQSPIPLQVLANEEVELSILLQRLAERIAKAGYIHRSAESHLDYCRETLKVIFVEGGDAAGVADSKKKTVAMEEFEITNHAKYVLDNINLTRKSTDKTIDTLRSKLSFEKMAEQR